MNNPGDMSIRAYAVTLIESYQSQIHYELAYSIHGQIG
jgi:hypothetical protein